MASVFCVKLHHPHDDFGLRIAFWRAKHTKRVGGAYVGGQNWQGSRQISRTGLQTGRTSLAYCNPSRFRFVIWKTLETDF
jgi:hypothetical protein